MNNQFSKLANSILSRALSKPATSLSSKAKAAIGLGGLAGAGALAHHYDMLLPNRVTSRLSNELNDFLTGGDVPLVSPNYDMLDSRFDTPRLIHDARYSVLAPSLISDDYYSIGGYFNEVKGLDHNTLEQLVTARDVASYTGKKHLIPAINKKIDSMLDLLNSDKAREYDTGVWALEQIYNKSPFRPGNPDKNALLRQWLNYDLNPWGATKATDIPIDLDKGRLVEADRLKGKSLVNFAPDARSGFELEDMVSGVDYDSALNEAASGIKAKRYTNKIVNFLEELRDEPLNSGKVKDDIAQTLESTENPLNRRIAKGSHDEINPIIRVDDHMLNPVKFNQGYTYHRVAPHHNLQGRVYLSDADKKYIDSKRGTGEFLLRPGKPAIKSPYSPIIDIDDENLIKRHRPKRKH